MNTNAVNDQPVEVVLPELTKASFPIIDMTSLEREELVFPVGFPEPLKRVALGLSSEKMVPLPG